MGLVFIPRLVEVANLLARRILVSVQHAFDGGNVSKFVFLFGLRGKDSW